MKDILLDNIKQDIILLDQELHLIEMRAEELRSTIDMLQLKLAAANTEDNNGDPFSADEEELPEVEIEIIVNEDNDTEEESDSADEDNTDEVLSAEELLAEETIEDEIVEAIETTEEKTEEESDKEEVEEETAQEDTEAEEEVNEDEAEEPQEEMKPEEPKTQEQQHFSSPLMSHVDDIRKAIALGDRFLFQRELFLGDGEKMTKTIEQLNQLTSLDEAISFIDKKFKWDKESKAYELFLNVLKRRF